MTFVSDRAELRAIVHRVYDNYLRSCLGGPILCCDLLDGHDLLNGVSSIGFLEFFYYLLVRKNTVSPTSSTKTSTHLPSILPSHNLPSPALQPPTPRITHPPPPTLIHLKSPGLLSSFSFSSCRHRHRTHISLRPNMASPRPRKVTLR